MKLSRNKRIRKEVSPKLGDKRTIKLFALLPKKVHTSGSEYAWIWLESYWAHQEYKEVYQPGSYTCDWTSYEWVTLSRMDKSYTHLEEGLKWVK